MQHSHTTSFRVTALAGIAWTVSNTVAWFGAGDPPELHADAGALRDYLADGRGALLAGAAVFIVTIPLLMTFLGSLAARLRGGDEQAVAASTVAVGGMTTAVVGLGVAYVLLIPLVLAGAPAIDDSLVQFLYALSFGLTMVGNAGAATVLLALGAGGASSGLGMLARRSATVVGVIVLGAAAWGAVDPEAAKVAGGAIFLVTLWMLAVSVGILRAAGASRTTVAAAAA